LANSTVVSMLPLQASVQEVRARLIPVRAEIKTLPAELLGIRIRESDTVFRR
jgi:hypothetical protein